MLLTLTVVNVSGDELGRMVDCMNVAWRRLVQRRVIKRAVRSWFRALEITYNQERQDFHPHFHIGRRASDSQIGFAKQIAKIKRIPEPEHLYDYHISLSTWIWRYKGGK